MLYEMTTGRPPFLGDDTVAVIGQHINIPPVARPWHNPRIPPALEALILRLLEKDPARRPQDVTTVRRELQAIADGAATPPSISSPPSRGNSIRWIGWPAACSSAENGNWRLCAPQSTRPSPVTGRSSSSPANRASARLGWPKRSRPTPGCGGQVLRGRSDDWEGAPAYWPGQVVRDHVHDRDPQSLRSDLGQGAVDIAHVVSDVRERLPDPPSPPPLEPEQARFRLFDGLVRSFRPRRSGSRWC